MKPTLFGRPIDLEKNWSVMDQVVCLHCKRVLIEDVPILSGHESHLIVVVPVFFPEV